MLGDNFLPDGDSALHLQVEKDEVNFSRQTSYDRRMYEHFISPKKIQLLSDEVNLSRQKRYLWQGFGFTCLMFLGLCAWGVLPLASQSDYNQTPLVAFKPVSLHLGQGDFRPTSRSIPTRMSDSPTSIFPGDDMPELTPQNPGFRAMSGSASGISLSLFSVMKMQTDIKEQSLLLLTLKELGCDIHEVSTPDFIIAKQDSVEYMAFKQDVKDGFVNVRDSGEYIAFKRDAKRGNFNVYTAADEWELPELLDDWMKRLTGRYEIIMRTALKQGLEANSHKETASEDHEQRNMQAKITEQVF